MTGNLFRRIPVPFGLVTLILLMTLACNLPIAIQESTNQEDPIQGGVATLPSPPTLVITPGSTVPAGFPAGDYPIGDPVLSEIYVSPDGSDGNDGLTAASPLRSLTTAWERIPAGAQLSSTGYRINLLPGTYPCEPAEPDNCQNYFGNRLATYTHPIILQAYAGPGTVILRGGLDLNNLSYLYLIDLTLAGGNPLPTNQSGNNLLHLAFVDHVLLRGITLAGPDCASDACNNLQEVLKVNQAQYLYVENSTIGGAWHSSVDFFAVQYGGFTHNILHTAGQWCMYVKGGSAYLRIEGNELHHCQLGFQAGQSSNLPVMTFPWFHYEAYDIQFINNLLHDIPGVGLSVSGGYNILLAYNTLVQVGTSTDPGYPLFQAIQGERGCSTTDEIPDPQPVCASILNEGGWGPDFLTDNQPVIPNTNVYFLNNLVYNPTPASTLYTHFYVAAPLDLPSGFHNLPDPIPADSNLVIAGNLIWNGPLDHPLGIDEVSGCAPTNPTCSAARLTAENTINTFEPQLVDPQGGDYRPLSGGNVFSVSTVLLPDFLWDAFAPEVPPGELSYTVNLDRLGNPRPDPSPPGAYAGE